MAAGDATAADCPGKYDVIIAGKGYCLLDSIESSIPFRTHKAIYGQTQPFVERQNVSNSYGDNTQDFFLTIRQRDWSLGEQQKYFRAGNDGRYWMGSNVEVSVPGQVRLSPSFGSLSFAAAVITAARQGGLQQIVAASSTTFYQLDEAGAITSKGAHGLGATPSRYAMCTDGTNNYISTTAAGSVGVRKWTGSAFSTFSASTVDSLAFLNNTLYGYGAGNLVRFDSAGTATTLFPWKDATGGAASSATPIMHPFGGKLLMLFPYAQEAAELWIYDGTGASRLAVFPENFIANDLDVLYGVAYVSGSFMKAGSTSIDYLKPAVLFFDGSEIGKLWEASDFNASSISSANQIAGPHTALGVNNGRLIFTDETTGNFMAYNPASGGVSTIGSYTPNTGDSALLISTGLLLLHIRNQTTAYYYPGTTYPSSGYVISSLIDFDSSLSKIFRGVTLEFDAASDGNGGSVDASYQLNGLAGSWTSLATGVTSGTEVLFPAATAGHSVAIKVTLNKGTSTSGPALKSMSLRGAPTLPIYERGEYIIDCTNNADQPRELRDGSLHPLNGYQQVLNLIAARNSQTPITITDKINGTYTGFIDVNDPQGFDVYEVRSGTLVSAPTQSGAFVARLTARGV